MKRMTMREFLSQELSKDVYIEGLDDYAEAFEGPIKLTAEGEKKFGEFLDYFVDVDEEEPRAWVNIPDEKDLEEEGERVNRFFQIVAGDISDKYWNKWFYFPNVFKFPKN